MRGKIFSLLAAGLLAPVLGLAQGAQKPPAPPVPPPQGVAPMEAPATLPDDIQRPIVRRMPYDEWLKQYYQVYTIPKGPAILLGHGKLRPHPAIKVVLEIVGEEGDNYLVRNPPPEDPQSAAHSTWWRNEATEIFNSMKKDYFSDKYLIVNNPDVPPPFTDQVRFVAADKGLPRSGRWQMSFDVADMNGDGLPDLVFGPQRTGQPTPYIILQQKDGSWKLWGETKWPTKGLKLDYGSVRVADFDGDGNKDIAIACHFSRTYVLYGDGKGNFTRFVAIPQSNPDMTSRALVVADFDGDGRPDVATYAEVDLALAKSRRLLFGHVNIALNTASGWQASKKTGFPQGIQGDWLTAADIDGDKNVDLLLTSRAQNVMDLVMRNLGKAESWEPFASQQMPANAYVLSNAAAALDRFKQPDLLECFEQFNPWKAEPATQACVIYRFHDAKGKRTTTPTAQVLFQEKVEYQNYQAAAVGDLNGDGRNDIAVATTNGKVRVFLQAGNGSFYEQRNPGLDQPGTAFFDARITDLDGDGRGELILAGSPTSEKQGGGVWVYKVARAPAPGSAGAPKAP
jgi:FG-GAP-like repeat